MNRIGRFGSALRLILWVLAMAVPAAAQAKDDDEWHFLVAPYLIVPGMQGTLGVGGIEVDTEVTGEPTVQYKLGERMWIGGGWRLMYVDYQTGYEDGVPIPGEEPFRYDMITTGPVLGMAFRF